MTEMVLVPREPTEAMMEAGRAEALKQGFHSDELDLLPIFLSMTDIASAPPVGEGMREKVAELLHNPANHLAEIAHCEFDIADEAAFRVADAIIRLLSSGEA